MAADSRQAAPRPPGAGLTHAEAQARLETHGRNELAPVRQTPAAVILLRQFTGLLVVILIVAAALAAVLGEAIDAIAISLVVALNGALGFVQEWRAETALVALRNMLATRARVMRDAVEQMIDTRDIVPGDLILLAAGDKVPADMSVLSAAELRIDESVLTGESFPVEKDAADPEARLFMGTSVVAGRAEGLVVATGQRTEFGRIADLTGAVERKPTHLQVKLGQLARQMGVIALIAAALVGAAGIHAGKAPAEMFMTALSLAVAVVPEGLPAVVTITLALGASAMVRQNALARRLQAVETLGAATVICTDKTGTLTEDAMTAARISMPGRDLVVTGTGYDPAGHIEFEGASLRAADDADLADLLETALLCNNARLRREGGRWRMVGEPTEGALVTLAYKGWTPMPRDGAVLAEMPFSSERKRMSVLSPGGAGYVLHVKGAPEVILERAATLRENGRTLPLDTAARGRLHAAYEALAARGMRVIALARAHRDDPTLPETERDLEFLGFVGLIDPPRPEVKEAIRGCQAAGIGVIMITGDGPLTARAIAEQLDLPVGRVLTGNEVERLTDGELVEALGQQPLFARSTPAHKLRIVSALQARGEIAAMTGDGVNDAPALKQADIGVAMGLRGTDVAKDAADLVLLDDNFATILRAIREGRRQYENVKKFVRYLLASNTGEVLAIAGNLVIGGPLVFLATQILWMNLITDGATAVALGLEKPTADQMQRPPRPRSAPILGRGGFATLVLFGTYTSAATLWIFYHFLPQGEGLARTAAFTAMLLFEKASVFAFRALTLPCSKIGWFSNPLLLVALTASVGAQVAAVYWPPMQLLLHTEALGRAHWQMIALLSLPLLILPELYKAATWRRRLKAAG
ncbi:HAD-IC family P-type ATPase [Actibacterium sp. MT2.3-13A]|uniref:cation-translocating P-type ATPase n=1 Tax=Actibacterium sp. MT2.3-13A TaxID=2828332 RepID=UPI001BA89392|nr:HAD-IC family P-type ATPase [Actibacterium sp. MT2.3-13A]